MSVHFLATSSHQNYKIQINPQSKSDGIFFLRASVIICKPILHTYLEQLKLINYS